MSEMKTTQFTNQRLCTNTGNVKNRKSPTAALFGEQYSLAPCTVDDTHFWVLFIPWVFFILYIYLKGIYTLAHNECPRAAIIF